MIEIITTWIIHTISNTGYVGVGLLMAIESAAIPLPSEIIMPFSGYLAETGRFTLLGISLAGAIGSVVGSVILYYIGLLGGRPFIEKYGRYFFISHHDLNRADRFFQRHGDFSTFIGRVLPVVRTFISFPAGVARVRIKHFIVYTFIGSFIWSWFLGWVGMKLGQNWTALRAYFHKFDLVIVVIALILAVYWIYRHTRKH